MSPLQTAKLWLIHHLDLAKDALHIYIGLLLFFGSAGAFRWSIKSWKPWAVVLAAALIGEAWDLRDSAAYHTRIDLWGNWKDIWNTMFWPTAILLLARFTRVFDTNGTSRSLGFRRLVEFFWGSKVMEKEGLAADGIAKTAALSTDTHCQLLVDQMRDRVSMTTEAFKTFLTVFSALIGGCVAARLQYKADAIAFAGAADAVAILATVVLTMIIADNHRSWWGYRSRLSQIAGIDDSGASIVRAPKLLAGWVPALVIVTMVLTALGFIWLNPLRM